MKIISESFKRVSGRSIVGVFTTNTGYEIITSYTTPHQTDLNKAVCIDHCRRIAETKLARLNFEGRC